MAFISLGVGQSYLYCVAFDKDGKRFLLRTPTTGVAGRLFQAVGVALPPNVQELPQPVPQSPA